jgi:hypothetical protein
MPKRQIGRRPQLSATERRIAARQAQTLNAIAIAVARLAVVKRLPLEKALKSAALGRDYVHAILTEGGVEVCRGTVGTDIQELLGAPHGRMPSRQVELWIVEGGANLYDLTRISDTKRGRRLLRRNRGLVHS